MVTLFISDLHLDSHRPAITALFLDFLKQRAASAEALYILGDLFEAWIGDDDDSELSRQITTAIKALTEQGVPVYFIHGNRDFLVGDGFTAVSGAKLLPEAVVINLYGTPTLIMHGDTLCIDDVDYQALRVQVRSPQWQTQVLALPRVQRWEMAKKLRLDSQKIVRQKAEDILDVNQAEVVRIMRSHGVRQLIHGHTHRPAIHELRIDGQDAQRIVLGDWYHQGNVLCCDKMGCNLETLTLQTPLRE